nr:aggregate spidroin 1 [Nephila pilipes]
MGCISHVVVLFSLVGTLAYSQQFYEPGVGVVQNDPLLDKSTGENFANVFERSLQMCGAFTNEEAREYKQIIIVLTDAFGSFPDLQKAPPGVLKATAAGFASAVAERTAADIGTGELWEKTRCVIQALRKAFIVTTGVTNPFFITEVEKLIEIFYLTKGISLPQFANQGEDIGGGVQGVEAIPTGNLEGAAPNALGEAVKGNKKKPSGYLGSGLISNTFHGIFGGGHKDDSYDTYSTESYPGPDGKPLPVEPAGPGTTPGVQTAANGKPSKLIVPTTPKAPSKANGELGTGENPGDYNGAIGPLSPEQESTTPASISGPYGHPLHIIPAGPGTTPGTVTGPDGKPNKFFVPKGAFTTPGSIPGPDGNPLPVEPAGPGTTPGLEIGPDGKPNKLIIPTTPKRPFGPGFNFQTPKPIRGPKGKPIQIVPAGPGTTPGTVTGPDGRPVKFVVPFGAFTTPGSIPGPDGRPIHVEPAGPGTTPGAITGPDGNINSIVLPSTPKSPEPNYDLQFQTPKPVMGPNGKPIQIVPAGPGTTPGTITGRDGKPVEFVVPYGAFTTPGSIPGPDGKPIHVEPAGPGTTPGAKTGSDGNIESIELPSTPKGPSPGYQFQFQTPKPVMGPNGKPIQIIPARPGTTPGTVTGPDGKPVKFIVPYGAFTTPGSIPGPNGKPIHVKPAGPGTTPGAETDSDGDVKSIVLPSTPKASTPGYDFLFPTTKKIKGPKGKPIKIIPAGPGTTPGTITGPDGKPTKFIVPQGAFTTPGSIPGPDGKPLPVEPAGPGTTPGLETGPDGKPTKLVIPTTPKTPQGPGGMPGLQFQTPATTSTPVPGPSGKPIQIIPAGPGTTPGTITGPDGKPTKFIVPKGAFTTPGTIPGPDGKPFPVEPAGPGTTPGVEIGPDGKPTKLVVPTTPKPSQGPGGMPGLQSQTPATTPTPVPGPDGNPIQIVPAGPGTTPGTVTGPDGKPTKFIVPMGAFTTPGSIPGPDGKPLPVEPAGLGTTPGIETGPDGKPSKLYLPTTSKQPQVSGVPPGLQFQTPATTPTPVPGPEGEPIQIIAAGPGTTPGTVTGPDGRPVKFVVPNGAFSTPGSIPGPDGKPIHVEPAGPGTTPGAKIGPDGNIANLYLPSTPSTPLPPLATTPTDVMGPKGQPILILPAGPGTTPGTVTGPDGKPTKFIVPLGAFTTPGSIPGPDGKPIPVEPAGPGTTPGTETDPDGNVNKIILPTTPKRPSKPAQMPITTTPIPGPGPEPIQIIPAGPGTTPGTVTGPDGRPTKFIVPQGAFTTPGTIPGPDGNPIPVEPEGPGNPPGAQTGPNGHITKIVIPTTTPLPPPPGPLNPNGKPIAPFGPGNVPTSPNHPGDYPGYAFQFPGYPDAPGSKGPVGYLDFSQLPSSISPEMEGPIGFFPDYSPEIGGPFPGFPPGPDNSGPGGFLNVNSLPDFVNPGYGFPGPLQAPLGYLNFSLLPDGYKPDFPGQFVFPGYPGSPGSGGKTPGGFLNLDDLPHDLKDKLSRPFSLPDLLQAIQPLFPGQSINTGAIPKDHLQDIPGFNGTYDNLKLSSIGDNTKPTGGVFYLPELVRLISYLPVGSFPNGPGTINQNGGFADPFNFPGLNGAPGYICDYPDNGDVAHGNSEDLGEEIKGNDNGPSGDLEDAAPDFGAPVGDVPAPSGNSMSVSKLQPPEKHDMHESGCENDVFSAFMKAKSALMDVSSSTGVNTVSQLTQAIISGISTSDDVVDFNNFFNKLSTLLSQVRMSSSNNPSQEVMTILMEGLTAALEALNAAQISGFRNDYDVASDLPVYTSFLNEILY